MVVAEWNRSITTKLLEGALETLQAAGVEETQIDVAWVPGSWEIPVVAQRLAQTDKYTSVICLGAVIRGETTHDKYLNQGVSLALMELSLALDLPILFGILTCESMEQAIHRAGGNVGNKGSECAESALKMVGLLKNCPAE
ncbi:MAG: 6,7-dimethyl-8-ribityllumazine synthase [Planctomycetes bacterium]|nr:6,7-dimethyl-8-ribityllumazine synthase [Planctomycetota bacterium]